MLFITDTEAFRIWSHSLKFRDKGPVLVILKISFVSSLAYFQASKSSNLVIVAMGKTVQVPHHISNDFEFEYDFGSWTLGLGPAL
jgi:hypothetical protein